MLLLLKNVLFTLLIPGTVAVLVPWLIVGGSRPSLEPISWPGWIVIAFGLALFSWCLWNFATVGRGTPGPWDPTQKVVVTGPYRWVRNPMYLAVLSVILGEGWIYTSPALVVYAAVVAVVVHTFVVVYEEPTLSDQFGERYITYREQVGRWLPRPPPSQERCSLG
jgi:protein-S-isoprenylcysteine O-methyltransferase Ste14